MEKVSIKNIFKKIKEGNLLNLLIIFSVTCLIIFPLIITHYYYGDDSGFHILNILALKKNIYHNFFNPVLIVDNIAKNFGYGTNIFYPPLSHYLTAYLSVILDQIGIGIMLTRRLFYLLILFLSGITMYYLSLRLSKSKKVALVSSLIYIIFPYHLSDIYFRDALAETTIFIFLPLIFLSLTYLFEDKRKFFIFFVLGYCGGILSHLTIMIYFTIILILFFIININKINKKTFIYLIFSSCIVLFITSPFWINIAQHKFLGDYSVFIKDHMVTTVTSLKVSYFFNIFNKYSSTKFYLGFVNIIALIISIIVTKKRFFKNYLFIIIFGLISLILATNIFPWNKLPYTLRLIQASYRFEIFVSISLALLAPLFLKKYSNNFFVIITIILLIFSAYFTIFYNKPKIQGNFDPLTSRSNFIEYDLTNSDNRQGLGWQNEYLPAKTAKNMTYYEKRNNDIICQKNCKIKIYKNSIDELNFKIITKNKNEIELPRLYYFGYKLVDSNNKDIKLYENSKGFLTAKVKSGKYRLTYSGTILYRVSKIISLISILFSFIFVILIKYRTKFSFKTS